MANVCRQCGGGVGGTQPHRRRNCFRALRSMCLSRYFERRCGCPTREQVCQVLQ